MKKKYPGGRTFAEWQRLPYQEKHAWVTQEQCDLLRYWATCKTKKRCRRDRTCRGDQFECFWKRREKGSVAEFAKENAKCAPLLALLNIGSK